MARFGKKKPHYIAVLTYSHDGKLVIAGDDYGKLVAWDRATGKQAKTYPGAKLDEPMSIALSPDGKELACGFGNEGIICWDVASGKSRKLGWNEPTIAVGYSKQGVIGIGYSEFVIVDEKAKKQTPIELEGLKLGFAFIDQSVVAGTRVATWAEEKLVIWDVVSRKVIHRLKTKLDVQTLAFSGSKLLVSEASRHTDLDAFEIWDVDTGKHVAKYKLPAGTLNATALSLDGKRVAVAYTIGDDEPVGKLAVWDGKVLADLDLGETLDVGEAGCVLAWSPDGKRVALGTETTLVYELPAK